MGRKVIIVSDDNDFVVQAKSFCEGKGGWVKVMSPSEWAEQSGRSGFTWTAMGEVPPLVSGSQTNEGAKILQFPQGGGGTSSHTHVVGGKVQTIYQMESVAIQSAIEKYRGNLTEAAKALGIGRATLYRKVKLYNIDPTQARRHNKKAA